MLDRMATANGTAPLAPSVWEVRMPSGKVCALVRTAAEARAVSADGRFVEVWTLDEIGRLIEGPWRDIGKVKKLSRVRSSRTFARRSCLTMKSHSDAVVRPSPSPQIP